MTELFSETMSGGVTDLFSSVGNAIGEGGNVIQAMGQSLLTFGGYLRWNVNYGLVLGSCRWRFKKERQR